MVRQREGAPGDLEWLKYIGGTTPGRDAVACQCVGRDAQTPRHTNGRVGRDASNPRSLSRTWVVTHQPHVALTDA